jgi:tetratricopeptide (TPR) repeat protein
MADAARKAEESTRRDYLRKEVGDALDKAERELKDLQQGLQTLLPGPDQPLTVSVLLGNMKQWQSRLETAKAFWQRAQALAKSSPGLVPPEQLARRGQLGKEVAAAESDFDIARRLDAVRLNAATLVDGKAINISHAAPRCESIFKENLSLDMRHGQLDALAKQVKKSSLRFVLAAALDFWADVTTDPVLATRLLEVARQADPDPWRDQVRDVKIWNELPQLKQLATDVQPQQQTPQVLLLLAQRLRRNQDQKAAANLLRTALIHHPADFWLNVNLSFLIDDPGGKAGCYRAALAIRPDSPAVHGNLGAMLQGKGDLKRAMACYQKALQLDPKYAIAHDNLGTVLRQLRDLDGAIACYRQALELDPKFSGAHINLGNALFAGEDMKGAIACYKKALEYDAASAPAHYNLGRALFATKDLDGAIAHLQKAVDLDPNFAKAHYNLGAALALKKDLTGAAVRFKKTLELDSKHVLAHYGLGNVHREQQDLDGAIGWYKKALDLNPRYTLAHINLGSALAAKGDVKEAIACYKKAIALDANLADIHCRLGNLLIGEDQLPSALKELEIGHKLGSQRPDWPHPSELWIQQCKILLALDEKWTAIQKGKAEPSGPAERIALAGLCQQCKKQYVAAAKLYAEAFSGAPNLATDLTKSRRYHAACAAAMAAAGQGKDAASLDAPAKAKLRLQALAWLKADRELWRRQADGGQPATLQAIIKELSHWQSDPELEGVRDGKALSVLPEAERKLWQSFWGEVDMLLTEVKK